MSHYRTLGVAEGADPEEVRRAYLELARQLHPDRWVDASPEERDDAGRRMQEINEAWRVLGNPGRRLAYDVERRAAVRQRRHAPPAPVGDRLAFQTGDLFVEDVPDVDLFTRILRALPWIAVVGGLLAIFVVTAYLSADDGTAPTGDDQAGCIRKDGPHAVEVDCGADGAQRVIVELRSVTQCPEGSDPYQPADSSTALCLAPPGD